MALGWRLSVGFRLHAPVALVTASLMLAVAGPAQAFAATPTASPYASSQAPPALESAQEISLGALGMGSQAVQGGSGSVGVFVPPPAGPLAGAGSFVRVFFAHSPLLDASASTLTVAVNGQPLSAVRLDGSNAEGSAFEARVSGSTLHADRPNLLQARFELRIAGAPATGDPAAYARLEPQTLLHYQLYGPPGSRPPPRLESYPFPFASRTGGTRLGLVLPQPAARSDLQAALRLALDLGRRTLTQQLQPEVVSTGAADWLRSSGQPAILVGTIGRQPLAERALRAAGFTGSATGWTAPDGAPLSPADGVLAASTSPFDGQSPLLFAGGFTDEGLSRALDALLGARGRLPAGAYAVLREAGAAAVPEAFVRAGGTASLDELTLDAPPPDGAGSRLLSVPFATAPVDPGRSGWLELRFRGALPTAPAAAVGLFLNGQQPVGGASRASTAQETVIRQSFSGALLRPGLNTFAVRIPAGAGAPPVLSGGRLQLPPAPLPGTSLELLPAPLFSDPRGVLVVLARLDDPVLSAAARGLAALGSRGGLVPSLAVLEASAFDERTLDRGGLVAIGGSGGSQRLERLRRELPGAGRVPEAIARVEKQALPGPSAGSTPAGRYALWVEGGSPALLQSAAAALYRHPLPGAAATVDAAGRLQALQAAGASRPAQDPPEALRLVVPALALAAAAATLLALGWQLQRPLESAW
jgi:cellulose synthase subunit